MLARYISGVLMAIIVLSLVYLGPAWAVIGVVLGVVALAGLEWISVRKSFSSVIFLVLALLSGAGLWWMAPQFIRWLLVLVGLLWVTLVPALLLTWNPQRPFSPLLQDALQALFLMAFALAIITLVSQPAQDGQPGHRLWLLYMLALSVAMDLGGYWAGRRWGQRKLASAISPGKTLEGLLGGLVLVILFSLVVAWQLDAGYLPVLSVLLAAPLALCGDLFASMLKRSHNIKDYSQMLPGHGGILDRVDSHCAVIPALSVLVLA